MKSQAHREFELIVSSRESLEIRWQVEHAFRGCGVEYELWGSSPDELRYEVVIPAGEDINRLGTVITRLGGLEASVGWTPKTHRTVRT